DDSSLSSEEEAEMSEPTWLAPDPGAVSDLSPASRGERMRHSPQNIHSKDDDGKNIYLIQHDEKVCWRADVLAFLRGEKGLCL
ncbi:hypothetical protein GOODEAATRI_025029, partial [Goodea atripinnis]